MRLSTSTLRRQMDAGKFPKPRRVGEVAIGWLLSDLIEWMHALPTAFTDEDPVKDTIRRQAGPGRGKKKHAPAE